MSAIWGKISFDSVLTDNFAMMREHYEKKCRIDAFRACNDANVHMACGIQHITPEAVNETLPIKDAHVCFTADCILDNRAELMELLAVKDLTLADGTLMYMAYQKWGINCLSHFRGTFALAIYDFREECLYLVADPTSSRCLYYYADTNTVTFSTLLTPILKLHPHIRVNEMYIKDYLAAPGLLPNLVPDETPYEQVLKLNPGTYIKFTKTQKTETRYWDINNDNEAYRRKNAKEYGELFYQLYEDAVKDTLRSSQNTGIALSSGLDSSTVGALASTELHKDNKALYTYTYVPFEKCAPDNNKDNVHNETDDVLSIAQMYPNMVTHFLCNEGKNCYDEIDDILDMLEIPFKAYVNFPNLREIYEAGMKDGCRIMLSGQTGNASVSHGYINDVLFDLYINKKYFTLLQYLNSHCKYVKVSRKVALKSVLRYFKQAKKLMDNYKFSYTLDVPFVNNTIFNGYPLEKRFHTAHIVYTQKIPVERDMYFKFLYRPNMYTYIGEFETKLGLKYNMVLRDPTKDERILRFCHQLPYKYFAYKGEPRWLVRGNFKNMLPPQIYDNWMRRGVQNSDWYNRLVRDWATIEPQILQELSADALIAYKNDAEIKDYMSNPSKLTDPNSEITINHIIFLCILSKFLTKRDW